MPAVSVAEPRPSAPVSQRLWEIDAVRGFGVVLMMVYHLLYDLAFLGISNAAFVPPLKAPVAAFQVMIVGLFIWVAGVSLSVSDGYRTPGKSESRLRGRLLRRGLRIFLWGMVVTAATRLAAGPLYVRFGVLHGIGAGIILAYPFLRHRRLLLPVAVVTIALGAWLRGQEFGFAWLLWLGLKPAGEDYVDYVPLLPWFGVLLAGIRAGDILYPNRVRALRLPEWGSRPVVRWLASMGRHSLAMYLLHQPVLVLLLLPLKPEALQRFL